MLRRSLALLLLVALALGVAWFHYVRQQPGERPQRLSDAPADTTEAAPEVRTDATVEASPEADLKVAEGEAGRAEARGSQEAAGTVTSQPARVKGEADTPLKAPAEPAAPARSAVVRGQAEVVPSEDAAAAVALDAQAVKGAGAESPPSEVAPTATHGPDSEATERAQTPERPVPGEQDEQVLAALPSDRRQPAGDVREPRTAAEPEIGAEAEEAAGTRGPARTVTRSDAPAAREPEAAPTPDDAGEAEASVPAAGQGGGAKAGGAAEGSTAGARGWFSADSLRQALAGMLGDDEGQEELERPSRDTAGTEAPEEPRSAREEAPEADTPSESLSAETIRRALAALVGGDEAPAPGAGPTKPMPEPETVEPEPVKPTFDIVRINRDRTAIIAGRAEPGAQIEVLVGDRTIDRISADRRGQWVSTPLEPLEPGDREMTAIARLEDGGRIESDQVVVVAVPEPPPPQPPAMAGAEPPPPQPPDVAASEAPPPQPPATAAAEAPEPTRTARAPAPEEAVAVLLPKDGGGGGRVLQAPGRISNDGRLALMRVDYDEEGKVRVAGEAPPGAPVRLYVDNQHAADVVTAASGEWQTVLKEELAPGAYTLRLDQLGPEGKPVARLETPFERVSRPPIEGQVEVDYIVVQPGNSLWRIARRLFGEGIKYVHIYEANQAQIRDPDLIYPGQVFEVPRDLAVAG